MTTLSRSNTEWWTDCVDFAPTDCELICHGGVTISWNKFLLSQWSGLLKQVLPGQDGRKVTVILPDVDAADLEKVLTWSHKGEVFLDDLSEVRRIQGVLKLLEVSVKFGTKRLRKRLRRAEPEQGALVLQGADVENCSVKAEASERQSDHVGSSECGVQGFCQVQQDENQDPHQTVEIKQEAGTDCQGDEHGQTAVSRPREPQQPKKWRRGAADSRWSCPFCAECSTFNRRGNKTPRGLLFHLTAHFSRELEADNAQLLERSFAGKYRSGSGSGEHCRYVCCLCGSNQTRKRSFLAHLASLHRKAVAYAGDELRERLTAALSAEEGSYQEPPKMESPQNTASPSEEVFRGGSTPEDAIYNPLFPSWHPVFAQENAAVVGGESSPVKHEYVAGQMTSGPAPLSANQQQYWY